MNEKQLIINDETIKTMFHNIDVAIMVIDYKDGEMLLFNKKVYMDLDVDCLDLEGRNYRSIFTIDFIKTYEELVNDCKDGEQHTIIFYWATRLIWEQISGKRFTWEGGREVILLTITNITDVASEEYKYEKLAYFDSITGLPNGKRLEADIKNLSDADTVALVYFQVKGLYDINNLYGFDTGDNLVLQVRDWLLLSERKKTQLYRGNHGLILLGYDVTLDDAIKRAKQILERFNHPWTLKMGDHDTSIYCDINIGIVFGKYVQNEMRTMLVRSLSAPKTEYGYSIYDEEADKKAEHSLVVSQSLLNCVHNDMEGFSISYQPIVEAVTENWVGVETLCRWHEPSGEQVSPLDFIKKAEKLGIVCDIDRWVRETAMKKCVEWGLDKKNFFLDVNFSSNQSINSFFIKNLLNTINKIGFPRNQLVIEITESERMQFTEENLRGLDLLRKEDIHFSLDDFGTGYSSFENLIKVPAYTIKTEKVFLDDIETDEYKQYQLQMIIDLAHHLDMRIICEGVETTGQRDLLRKYGADYMQGFLFSRPLTEEEFAEEKWRYGQ